MKTYSRLTLVLVSVWFYASSYAEDIQFDFGSKHAQAAMEKYRATVTKVQERGRKDLIRDLEAAFKHERSDGDFDEAVKIRNAIKILKESSAIPQGPQINNESLEPNTSSDGEHISKLLVRDGLGYLPNTSHPYTGKCFDLYPSGQTMCILDINKGHAVSMEIWYSNGSRKAALSLVANPDYESLLQYARDDKFGPVIQSLWFSSRGIQPSLNGKCIFWHDNEQIATESVYVNGKIPNGLLTQWNDGGEKETFRWNDGMRNGLATTWYTNGQKQSEGDYADGMLIGKWTFWHENGRKSSEGHFDNDFDTETDLRRFKYGLKNLELKMGLWIYWYENGQKKSETFHKSGTTPADDLYQTEEAHEPIHLATWHENGQKKSAGNINEDKLDGSWSSWYDNGQKEMEGQYRDGKRNGFWRAWLEDGKKWQEAVYKDGNATNIKTFNVMPDDPDTIWDESWHGLFDQLRGSSVDGWGNYCTLTPPVSAPYAGRVVNTEGISMKTYNRLQSWRKW